MSSIYDNEKIDQIGNLLSIIGSPFEKTNNSKFEESIEIHEFATKNKVSLLYLDSLKNQEKLIKLDNIYEIELKKYRNTIDSISKISEIFNHNNIKYIVFKTLKPYISFPGDIDILILGDEKMYLRAVQLLHEQGYTHTLSKVAQKIQNNPNINIVETLTRPTYGSKKEGLGHISPTGTDFFDKEFHINLDLQKDMALSYVVYMNKRHFCPYIGFKCLNRTKVFIANAELDLAIVISHSIAEQMFLLGEFYTFLYRLSDMDQQDIESFINIIKKNNMQNSVKLFLTIAATLYSKYYGELPDNFNHLINEFGFEKSEANKFKKNFQLPYKYSFKSLSKVFFEKLKEKKFRDTVILQFYKMLNPKLFKLVVKYVYEMRIRESYLKNK